MGSEDIFPYSNKTKEKILQVLSSHHELTAKEIHSRLYREFSTSNSYQATHKTLKQMRQEQILLRKENKYSINSDWAEKFRRNAEQLVERVKNNLTDFRLEDLKENESKHLSFKGIPDVGWFLIDRVMGADNQNKKPSLALWRFCYSIVGLETKHYARLREALSKNRWIAVVEEDTPVGHMFAETLIRYGIKEIKFGVKCATKLSDKMIAGSYIVEITYPSAFRKLWEIEYKLPKKIAQFSLSKHLMQMREMQPQIEVIVTNNRNLADDYRNEYTTRPGFLNGH